MRIHEHMRVSVHHYADVLLNQPQLMFSGSVLENVQQLRHNSHPQFRFRSAGGTYSDPNNNVYVYLFAVASIYKLIIESLETKIDESVMKLLTKQLNIEVTSDGQVLFNDYGKSLVLLNKRSNEISNPSDLPTTLKDAINRLDYSHKLAGLNRGHFFNLFEKHQECSSIPK